MAQDIGRVLLNLINNAFYVVSEKSKRGVEGYEPTVTVRTKRINHSIEIRVKDNGDGIPANVINKIFQPFFTTKPTGEGTGLGLSLSYDIITKGHNGSLGGGHDGGGRDGVYCSVARCLKYGTYKQCPTFPPCETNGLVSTSRETLLPIPSVSHSRPDTLV